MNNFTASSEGQRISPRMMINKVDDVMDGKYFGIPIVDKFVDKGIKKLQSKAKSHFGAEIKIKADQINPVHLTNLYDHLAQFCPRLRRILAMQLDNNRINRYNITNQSFFFKEAYPRTFVSIKIGSEYRSIVSLIDSAISDTIIKDDDIYIYIFGKGAYSVKKKYESILVGPQAGKDTIRSYKVSGDSNPRSDVAFKSIYQDVDKRDLDTIFMEDGVVEPILNHIDKFIENKDVYGGRGIIYKTGILLYGEPGTGKTSLIKALTSKYGYDLLLLDMATFDKVDIEILTHSINIDDSKYIIALEDIDCVIADRENKAIDKDEKKLVNKLLQFLDSNSSPNNVIFIASTNHIELLDEALLREGRFDLKIKVGGIYMDKAIEMCRSFNLSDTMIDKVIAQANAEVGGSIRNKTIRQSKLQSIILKYSGLSLKGEVEDDEESTEESSNNNIAVNEID